MYRIDCDVQCVKVKPRQEGLLSHSVAVTCLPAYNCCKPREFTRICAWEARIAMSHRLTLQFWFVRSGGRMKFGVVQSVVAYSVSGLMMYVCGAVRYGTGTSVVLETEPKFAGDRCERMTGDPQCWVRGSILVAGLASIAYSSQYSRTCAFKSKMSFVEQVQLQYQLYVRAARVLTNWDRASKILGRFIHHQSQVPGLYFTRSNLGSTGGQSSAKLEAAYGSTTATRLKGRPARTSAVSYRGKERVGFTREKEHTDQPDHVFDVSHR
ncbi:hypothetical protein FGSG_02514 [Fusarium graminearum PH-1]|uniref:hypothetical protein n=1 Tax=Gibberella zeae (strain ATCC MYA-4620 / CBS 123657 / FGSC 9075 / NRRL 31084 / PH-1) TaxID=229533 RepID=UPI000023DCA2|nr:hypothetical protein FGSG_02514 [Fusarium graminearum PH-1]ESU07962.1 hypothetical protein FGSG_02514 [Fusarium graminearum PH-1]EYB31684.1 hypothetical protein FG05_02514 [Fusarium graminearum]|eukprot:XP_011318447.1 hypothetical protein FGSG_02514 [Fusarium graminearum PH-1]